MIVKFMSKNEIIDLCTNPLIEKAYKEFAKKYNTKRIVDMWSNYSMNGNRPDYAYIKYMINNKIYTYEYDER